ncbi:uncharacterized protein A1O9_09802 [Exophiala aquamarina CBS 119918]|uniref:Uncharacterized protein n=1 Tax=Exophiala aquamarina CBS 119918 TaxID=1182545 RepID=A0A072P2T0_9EURO|nr:uncharacterized protein A1O9_09802 [Exophiala aquamarina CBS 119918]KEF54007.1 hypothetical protein A1O9_09802 [Exophiala aquamarina CBS 119918]
MLARAWEADKAISIWVELVNERQAEISQSIDDRPQFIPTFMAARQDITREELAKWDASARSWLHSAEGVKQRANKQMMLIVKNICVNVGEGKTTYQNVINVWRHSLVGMESLVQGRPQEAFNGSVLLALSAWHIYPHTPYGIGELCKIGGVSRPPRASRRYHYHRATYRLYDREAKVHSRAGTDRVSTDELLVVAFASLFWAWEISRDEEIAIANRLVKLYDLVKPIGKPASFPWLELRASASRKFLALKAENDQHCSQLITWGRRRAQNFLSFHKTQRSLFFGLRRSPLLQALSLKPGAEKGILHLREVACAMKIRDAKYVIRYCKNPLFPTYAYCTSIPHRKRSSKCSLDESVKTEEVHYT